LLVMVWRTLPAGSRGDKAAKKQAIMDRILSNQPVGLLAYRGTEPVAWCSVAPRDTYRPLGGLDGQDKLVWSVVCLFLKREIRGAGIGTALLRAATEHARRRGADILEAYPVDPESPSYRFMGFVPVFEALGIQEVGQAGNRRHVLQLRLR
jgi:GNAT superfamily N-acetyltransferase